MANKKLKQSFTKIGRWEGDKKWIQFLVEIVNFGISLVHGKKRCWCIGVGSQVTLSVNDQKSIGKNSNPKKLIYA